MTESYYISLCDIEIPEKKDNIIFKFDFKQDNSECSEKNLKGQIVNLDMNNQNTFSHLILACYSTDFERITKNHINYHLEFDNDITFLIEGKSYDDDKVKK